MRKTIAIVAAMAALTGCDQLTGGDAAEDETAEAEEAEADGEDEAEAEPETVMLANGAPAFPGMDVSAAEVREPNGDYQYVSYQSGSSMFEIHDFYRNYYENDGHDISSLSVSANDSDREVGGSVNISLNGRTGGSRVSVSPASAEGGEFDLSKVLGNGIPAYPGVAVEDVDVTVHDSGRRSIRFETDDAPIEVFNFYRNAFETGNLQFNSVSLNAQSREYRRRASITATSRYNATGSRVSTSVYDPNRQTASGDGDK